jgi:hypothetical protein
VIRAYLLLLGLILVALRLPQCLTGPSGLQVGPCLADNDEGVSPALAVSAVGFPPAPPESGGKPASGITPEKPLESGVPLIPPSHQGDPGIQVVPEKRGDPRVGVKPRDLDPDISTIPDVAPPAHKDINPHGVGTQERSTV